MAKFECPHILCESCFNNNGGMCAHHFTEVEDESERIAREEVRYFMTEHSVKRDLRLTPTCQLPTIEQTDWSSDSDNEWGYTGWKSSYRTNPEWTKRPGDGPHFGVADDVYIKRYDTRVRVYGPGVIDHWSSAYWFHSGPLFHDNFVKQHDHIYGIYGQPYLRTNARDHYTSQIHQSFRGWVQTEENAESLFRDDPDNMQVCMVLYQGRFHFTRVYDYPPTIVALARPQRHARVMVNETTGYELPSQWQLDRSWATQAGLTDLPTPAVVEGYYADEAADLYPRRTSHEQPRLTQELIQLQFRELIQQQEQQRREEEERDEQRRAEYEDLADQFDTGEPAPPSPDESRADDPMDTDDEVLVQQYHDNYATFAYPL